MATYQASIAPIVDTIPHWKTFAQFWGGGFTTAGWVLQTGHGEVNASGTGATYAWSDTGTVITLPTTALVAMRNYRFNGAWVSGNTYTGGNTADGTTTCDLVTFASGGNTPITYVHITATSNSATNPSADTTNWQPFMYEVWKSNGASTASAPIYCRIIYTVSATGNTGPRLLFSVGTGIDANGQLTGTVTFATSAPLNIRVVDNLAAGNANAFECDFSGDADNFRFVFNRGNTISSGWIWAYVLDRAKTGVGVDSDAFFFSGSLLPTGGTFISQAQIVPKVTLSPPLPRNATGWPGTVFNGGATTSQIAFGVTPPYPIFPVVGYLSNPLLGAMTFNNADVLDGAILPVWIYGATHYYLVQSLSAATAAGSPVNVGTANVLAILWE